MRTYPDLPPSDAAPTRPITFITVRFSNEYHHNIAKSECVKSAFNQLLVIDNTSNLFHKNLSSAINSVLDQAVNDIVTVVHEDVVLLEGWQQYFEQSLSELEQEDPNWGMLGSVGWDEQGEMHGHWSAPRRFANTFSARHEFRRVARLDEQILIFHRSRLPIFDIELPGIHHLGQDLAAGLTARGYSTYAIDAPTIHKYADENGRLILSGDGSKKIVDRSSPTYLADLACCDDYIREKYSPASTGSRPLWASTLESVDLSKIQQLERPLILIGRGDKATALLHAMATELGIFLGGTAGNSGQTPNLVMPIYQGIIEKFQVQPRQWQARIVARLRHQAALMIEDVSASRRWGVNLSQCSWLIPEIAQAFPNAQFVHLVSDPLTLCVLHPDTTASLDNHVGRVTLAAAYDHLGEPRKSILVHSPGLRVAHSVIHQFALVQAGLGELPAERSFEFRLEAASADLQSQVSLLASYAGMASVRQTLETPVVRIEPGRRTAGPHAHSTEDLAVLAAKLAPLRRTLGYT